MKQKLEKAGQRKLTFIATAHGPDGEPRPNGTKTIQCSTMAEAVASLVTEDADRVIIYNTHDHTIIRSDRRYQK